MKSNKTSLGIFLLFLGTILLPVTAQNTSVPFPNGNWLYVGGSGPGNYTQIQDAIDDANDGDTIFVYSGTYIGYVIINKAITLVGQEKNSTIIIGYFAYTISFVTDSTQMSGFTIYNNADRGEGVRIDSSYNTITNTIIDIPNDRIRLYGHNNTFSGNTIKNTYLYISGDDNLITDNVFVNAYQNPFIDDYYGIYLMDCWNNIISENSFFNSGIFISMENLCDNIVTDNTVNTKPLLYMSNQSNLILDDTAGQIVLVNCTNITIQNQEIKNTTVGIQIVQSNSCLISSNTITGSHYGICLNGWDNHITTNTITNNYYGLELSGHDNIIQGNTLSSNRDGVYLDNTDSNILRDNIITNNEKSCLLDYGSDFNDILNNTLLYNNETMQVSGENNNIVGNMIAYTNDHGIFFISSDNNVISTNTITQNNGYGLLLSNCNHNTIIKNTITNQSHDGIILKGNDASLSNNTIAYNTNDGIVLQGEHNNISMNTITHNKNGISIMNHQFNILIRNDISENTESGICLNSTNNTIISKNRISNNTQGLLLIDSGNNTVNHNLFLRNKRHAFFINYTNNWDQNYWGRPRLLPKIIFGKEILQNEKIRLLLDFDWHPAFKSYINN